MDESKEYIDMCKKLPENVKQDFENAYPIDDVGSVCVLDDGEIGYIGTHLGGWQCHGYDCSGENKPVTQLYTQDQLQDIYHQYIQINRGSNLNGYGLIIEVFEFARRNWIENYSMEQLWLAFIMHEKYGKIWNREEWI